MPLKPVSMARTVKEKQNLARPFDERPAEEIDDYPYHLTITLTRSELQKLGMNRGQLETGDMVALVGVAMVTSTSAEMVNSMEERTVVLHIHELGIELVDEIPSQAQRMYGDSQ